MIFDTFIFYMCLSSIVFVYGIGFTEFLSVPKRPNHFVFHVLRLLCVTITSVLIVWPITNYILLPAKLQDIFPLFAIFVLCLISTVFIFVFKKILTTRVADFILAFLTILLSISESFSFVSAIMIVLFSILMYCIVIFGLDIFCSRLRHTHSLISFNYGSLLLLSIAFVLLILYSINISWLNFEVL